MLILLPHESSIKPAGGSVSVPRILSISFDSSIATTRSDVLAQAGYEVLPATSTTRAFELLNETEFALVIIGQSVPVAERRLLFLEVNRKWGTPVLLVDSGEADPLIRARAHVSAAATREEVLAAVASVVPQKKSRQSS